MGYSGHSLDADTAFLWRFDETDPTASALVDIGPHGRNFTTIVHDGTAVLPGVATRARALNANNYAGVAVVPAVDSPVFDGDFTIELWLFPTYMGAALGQCAILAIRDTVVSNSWWIRIDESGQFIFFYYQDSSNNRDVVGPAGTVTESEWQHLAVRGTQLGGSPAQIKLELFRNGVLVASGTVNKYTIASGSQQWVIGSNNTAVGSQGAPGYTVAIDDVRVSSVARTDAEIAADYQAGASSSASAGPALHDVAADLTAQLEAAGIGLTRGTNLFVGRPFPDEATDSGLAVYLVPTGGQQEPYMGGSRTGIAEATVQMLIRGNREDYQGAQTQASSAWSALHLQAPAGYASLESREPGPYFLGWDGEQRPLFTCNFVARYEYAPS